DLDISERKYKDMKSHEQAIIDAGGIVYKKPHYHVIYVAKNPVTTESVRNKIKRALGGKSVSHIEITDSVEWYFNYLTHDTADARKHHK
ncbi:Rep family protein, partial [Bacillus cereus]